MKPIGLVTTLLLVTAVVGLVRVTARSLPELRRYLKIRSM
jgi:hypothetical protein